MKPKARTTHKLMDVQTQLPGIGTEGPNDLPGLGPTDEELTLAQVKAAAFFDQEVYCPRCRRGGGDDKTVVWDQGSKAFRCYRCNWEDSRLTDEAKNY